MIEKNQIYELNITGIGSDGEGVGNIDGFVVFVKDALLGETVEVLILKVLKNYAYGKVVKVISPSPHRAEISCPHFKQCGGCAIQYADYEYEIEFKTQKVKDCMERIGGIFTEVMPCISCEKQEHYRNKAIFPVTVDGIGFYAPRSHRVIPVENCLIQNSVNNDIISIVKEYMNENNIAPYNEKSHTGVIRNIFTRIGVNTGELMVGIVTRTKDLPKSDDLVKMVIDGVKPVSIIHNYNPQKTNVALGKENKVLYGKDYITDKIGDLSFEISLNSFFQINPTQTKVLYDKVVEFCDFKGDERVFDLYCGIGTISLYVARYVKEVVGVETIPQAVENAGQNAEINNIKNAKFYVGNAENVTQKLGKADIVIVDPPRKGCDVKLLETINKISPEKIVYVSCNPATLARDLKILSGYGFEVSKIQPIDMFPRTAHIETICLLFK